MTTPSIRATTRSSSTVPASAWLSVGARLHAVAHAANATRHHRMVAIIVIVRLLGQSRRSAARLASAVASEFAGDQSNNPAIGRSAADLRDGAGFVEVPRHDS